jgi:hypothetical protein
MPKKGTKMVRRPHTRRKKVGFKGLKVYDPFSEPTKVKGVWKKKKK